MNLFLPSHDLMLSPARSEPPSGSSPQVSVPPEPSSPLQATRAEAVRTTRPMAIRFAFMMRAEEQAARQPASPANPGGLGVRANSEDTRSARPVASEDTAHTRE